MLSSSSSMFQHPTKDIDHMAFVALPDTSWVGSNQALNGQLQLAVSDAPFHSLPRQRPSRSLSLQNSRAVVICRAEAVGGSNTFERKAWDQAQYLGVFSCVGRLRRPRQTWRNLASNEKT